jgi:hypothetical protein
LVLIIDFTSNIIQSERRVTLTSLNTTGSH